MGRAREQDEWGGVGGLGGGVGNPGHKNIVISLIISTNSALKYILPARQQLNDGAHSLHNLCFETWAKYYTCKQIQEECRRKPELFTCGRSAHISENIRHIS